MKVIYTRPSQSGNEDRFVENPFVKIAVGALFTVMGSPPATTHTCPVCGHTGPCTRAAGETGQYRYHNCHVCGSTWKELKSGAKGDTEKESQSALQTA